MQWIYNPRTVVILKWVTLIVLLLVAASCDGSTEGLWQGGGDDTPTWR